MVPLTGSATLGNTVSGNPGQRCVTEGSATEFPAASACWFSDTPVWPHSTTYDTASCAPLLDRACLVRFAFLLVASNTAPVTGHECTTPYSETYCNTMRYLIGLMFGCV